MLTRPAIPRVHWSAENGWAVDSTFALSASQLRACVDYVKKAQRGRIPTTPGPKRDQMRAALKALSVRTLKVNLLPESGFKDGERVIYKPESDRRR